MSKWCFMGDGYHYTLELHRRDSSLLGQVPVKPDWEPALQCCFFSAIRSGRLPPVMEMDPYRILPVWDRQLGVPYIVGVRVVFLKNGRVERYSAEISTSYFREQAQRASSHYVERGSLYPGEIFWYRVYAFPQRPELPGEEAKASKFTVRQIARPLPLGKKSLKGLVSNSVFLGQAEPHEADFPVFVPRQVLDELVSLTAEATGANEIGGVLIGKLYRDTASAEIMAVVTAQIVAEHTRSRIDRLTFTAETWTAARAAIDLRGDDELMIGWWHAHNFMKETCKGCNKSEEGKCPSPVFMSSHDVHFQRTAFSRPWNIALVIGDCPHRGVDYALFGWRHGMVHSRPFHILDDQRPPEA